MVPGSSRSGKKPPSLGSRHVGWHDHVHVYAASRQSQKAGAVDSIGGEYTMALTKWARAFDSLADAHEQLVRRGLLLTIGVGPMASRGIKKIARSEPAQVPTSSPGMGGGWYRTSRPDLGRKALIIVGEGAEDTGAKEDGERMRALLRDVYGVRGQNIMTLDGPSVSVAQQTLASMFSRGTHTALLYLVGHALVDNAGMSYRARDGRVDKQVLYALANAPGSPFDEGMDQMAFVLGIDPKLQEEMGLGQSTRGMAFTQKSRRPSVNPVSRSGAACLLHENRLKEILNRLAPSVSSGITVVVDACFSGALTK